MAEDNKTTNKYVINITIKDDNADITNIQTDIQTIVFNPSTKSYDLGFITKENTTMKSM